MKLVELINGLNESFVIKNNQRVLHDDFQLYPKHLSLIKNQLLSCDEFKDCDLKILSLPNITKTFGSNDASTHISSESLPITPGMKFKGRAYVYSMWLTPEMYDPSVFLKKIKGDGGITPVIYSPNDYTPEKFIIIKINPEEMQDSASKQPPINAQHRLHSVLDNILNNPIEYYIKGDRHVVIRGVFESIEFESGKVRNHPIYDSLLENYVMK